MGAGAEPIGTRQQKMTPKGSTTKKASPKQGWHRFKAQRARKCNGEAIKQIEAHLLKLKAQQIDDEDEDIESSVEFLTQAGCILLSSFSESPMLQKLHTFTLHITQIWLEVAQKQSLSDLSLSIDEVVSLVS